jgi:hypothetical protein
MSNTQRLTRQQLAVIDDLFLGKLDEPAILRKHNVSRTRYEQWLEDDRFVAQFEKRISRAYQQTRLLLARNARAAAEKLVGLTKAEKGERTETTRKACLDIITFRPPSSTPSVQIPPAQQASTPETPDLSPETASRLLAALAKEPHAQAINP